MTGIRVKPLCSNAIQSCDARTIRRIVKVNHAGEHGAIQIDSAQISVARRLFPEIASTLS